MKKISVDVTKTFLTEEDIGIHREGLVKGMAKLRSEKEDFTGWVKLPVSFNREEHRRIIVTAEKIREKCDVFVVIGIGGSYLGARAAVEMMTHGFEKKQIGRDGKAIPEVYFAGQNLSGTYHSELMEKIKDREVCLCIISKSGTTTEPSIAFAILKEFLIGKYGKEEAGKRIYAITDGEKGVLREEVTREGYESFIVPDDIGGRYSVLTPVGLLPIAVAGIDISEMLSGAESAGENSILEAAKNYAAARLSLLKKGKQIEIFEYYEPKLQYFAEWLKQLFGESEGKDGKGIFPAALQFSADLHSMGQFLQEGNQIFFETVLDVNNPEKDMTVPEIAGSPLSGKSMNEVNRAALKGVMAAHRKTGVPIIKINLPDLTPFTFGQMVYFFETACALSGYLMGVNPFNQPGVESYKAEMKKAL